VPLIQYTQISAFLQALSQDRHYAKLLFYRLFLTAWRGNWRSSIYISCQETNNPGYLRSADRDGRPPPFPKPSVPDGTDRLIGDWTAVELLPDCKRRYSGVVKLGADLLGGEKIRRDIVEKRLPEL